MQTNTSWSENDIKFSQHNTSIVINYIHLATAQYRIQLYTCTTVLFHNKAQSDADMSIFSNKFKSFSLTDAFAQLLDDEMGPKNRNFKLNGSRLFTGQITFLSCNQQCRSTKDMPVYTVTTTTPQPFYGPSSGTTRVSQCQKRTSGHYGARED